MAVDSAHLVASLHYSGAKLELKTIDLCFLAALYGRENDEGLTSIGDEDVVEVFAQVCELVEPDPDNVRRRATNAIQRLRDQKLLARIDGRVWCAPATTTSRRSPPASSSSSSTTNATC